MAKDFSKGKISTNIISQSIPLMLAQLVHLLYNIVDRIYIGHLPEVGSMALTGIGLIFPITTLVAAFTNLFSFGGTPLFAIARGAGEEDRADEIVSQVAFLLIGMSLVLTGTCYVFRKPILYLFGAGDESYVYADAYLRIYLLGTVFAMFATGMNGFINAQGFPKIGMYTVSIGAVLNLILDPIFIFGLNMGVQGAALATVVSQVVSAGWVILFFIRRSSYKIHRMPVNLPLYREILGLGLAGFIQQATNSLVQIVYNITLKGYGGDLYVGIMTVINSVREVLSLPVESIASASQPVMGFNFGARKYDRVRQGIRFTTLLIGAYTLVVWGMIMVIPKYLIAIFTPDPELIRVGTGAMRIYFFGFIFMTFQSAGQAAFTSLGCAKRAIFFSLFRKAMIVAPLTVILPMIGLGVKGALMAEPISNLIGGAASFTTMYITLYRRLPKQDGVPMA